MSLFYCKIIYNVFNYLLYFCKIITEEYMELILVEYINNEKFGKIAHFLEDDKDVYSRVFEDEDNVYYEELSESETR